MYSASASWATLTTVRSVAVEASPGSPCRQARMAPPPPPAETISPVVEAVDQEPDVIVTRKVGIAAELAGPHRPHIGVIAAHHDVQRVGVVGHFDDRALCGGRPLPRFALAEVVDRVRRRPERLVQPAVERDRRPDKCGLNLPRARSAAPVWRVLVLSHCHAGEQADPCEREGYALLHGRLLSTSPTSPAARINTGSGTFLGVIRSARVTTAMSVVAP